MLNVGLEMFISFNHDLQTRQVFYFKMKGDYHRYMAEYLNAEDEKSGNEVIEEAQFAYKSALDAAKALKATNPIRLGLALNFSVFYYEIMQNQKQACSLAKKAFDTAVCAVAIYAMLICVYLICPNVDGKGG